MTMHASSWLRSKRHDAVRDVIFYALLVDKKAQLLESRDVPLILIVDRPGGGVHLDFLTGRAAYFDVSVRNFNSCMSAVSAGAAAFKLTVKQKKTTVTKKSPSPTVDYSILSSSKPLQHRFQSDHGKQPSFFFSCQESHGTSLFGNTTLEF